MSLINQVLLDLEKRRASGTDRSALPDHVRALPEMRQGSRMWWIVVAGGLVVTMVVAWAVWSGIRLPGSRPMPPAVAPQAVSPPEDKVAEAAATPAAMADMPPRQDATVTPVPDSPRAGLSLELSNVPATMTEKPQRAAAKLAEPKKAPVATADVIAKAPVEPKANARSEAAAAAPVAAAPVPPVAASASKPANTGPQALPSKAEEPAPKRPAVAAVKPGTRAASPEIDKHVRQLTPQQLAENDYGKAMALLNQGGKLAEAREAFETALRHNPAHLGARQALFGLLIEAKNYAEAERVLREGLQLNPGQTSFTMALARLQVDRGNNQAAIDILQKGMAEAQNNADYHAFLAALLQRQQRHAEAIERFQAALNLKPQSGVWLMGLGISLQALNRNPEAQEAYRRAKASASLNADLQAFVDQRLRQLQ